MRSAFDLNRQNGHVESKIVVALERISEAFRVLLLSESKENSLGPVQIQLLIFLLYHSAEKCKVSYLAREFNMTKPTISDSIRLLLEKKLIEKSEDSTDTRSYNIRLTEKGKQTAEKSAHFAGAIEKPLNTLSHEQKDVMLSGLLKLIFELNKAGIITVQRMCFTCANYRITDKGHYCNLLQLKLTPDELRVDCPEHEPVMN